MDASPAYLVAQEKQPCFDVHEKDVTGPSLYTSPYTAAWTES